MNKSEMECLRGKVAIVTGASRGIGRATAEELSKHGSDIVINYHSREDLASDLRTEIAANGGKADIIRADVSDFVQVQGMMEFAMGRFGHIDILVNNAGIVCDRTIEKMSFDEWGQVLQVDLVGVFNCIKAVVPHMKAKGKGSIVNISSIIGEVGGFGQANYAAAKAGVLGLTKSCALEFAKYGITVNAICPGYVETDMWKTIPANLRERVLQRIPLGRLAEPEEIAKCIRFLVTEGTYITGETINVTGGLIV